MKVTKWIYLKTKVLGQLGLGIMNNNWLLLLTHCFENDRHY